MPQIKFGEAIELVKQGKSIARAGWNGKNMFVFLQKGAANKEVHSGDTIGGVRTELFDNADSGIVTRMPSFVLQAADGSHVVGWLASQTDMSADDWVIVDN